MRKASIRLRSNPSVVNRTYVSLLRTRKRRNYGKSSLYLAPSVGRPMSNLGPTQAKYAKNECILDCLGDRTWSRATKKGSKPDSPNICKVQGDRLKRGISYGAVNHVWRTPLPGSRTIPSMFCSR